MNQCSPVLSIKGASKRFGPVVALRDADLTVGVGKIVGLVGHNGAGKSTLVNILAGNLPPDSGEILIGGQKVGVGHAPRQAHQMGLRVVFQELSLCPNLDVSENTRIVHREIGGPGWRRKAQSLIKASLDLIFPGHGIDLRTRIGDLPIAHRQMVEVARALTIADDPLRLVILDEPTSALGSHTTEQLLDHIRRSAAEGMSFILITHRLDEIYTVADEIVVMKDGSIAAVRSSFDLPQEELVRLMGGGNQAGGGKARSVDSGAPLLVNITGQVAIEARAGEVIGFAGLDGHGQRDVLLAMATGKISLGAAASFVAGDRQSDGVFPIWSIAHNLSISSLEAISRGLLLSNAAEKELAETWRKRIGIRSQDTDQTITTLSGGNQQKVLFARALAAAAPIVLLDDPMRGVDVGTKIEVYDLIRKEANNGRTFVWYSTEVEELTNCDRVYVFREGQVVARLDREDVSQHRIIEASFQA